MPLSLRILLVFMFLLFISAYIFIPSSIKVSKIVHVKSSNEAVYKFLQNPRLREKWWPKEYKTSTVVSLPNHFNNSIFSFGKGYLDYLPINVSDGIFSALTELSLLTTTVDSTELQWQTTIRASLNPIKRLIQYKRAKTLHADFDEILSVFKSYIEDDKKVYGLDIQVAKVINPTLLTTKFTSASYPTTELIYNTINQLRTTIRVNGALQVDSPMLNIKKNELEIYETQVAIPVNISFKVSEKQSIKMMVLGRILVTRIIGGTSKIESSFVELENYLTDKHLVSPALPYQSLITNRIAVPDTTKWITKIYYPIY